ncbi:unnamed protein product [Cuscuta campestris]|uniref:Integrase catalytic domain-containing protein n=1 Tax=Cuscuta campestris TaxID=132261 RepID=A0A484M294_9ASTE|nr:unnamed protein product [Cuscuta campestris]
MKVVGSNVHFKKLEAKCYSPAFYEAYLEMIAAQELYEFLHMEIRFKYEEEVLEIYTNRKVTTVQSKKNPQRSIQVIESTVGGTEVKISQKKLKKKLHLPNSGIDIGKLSSKNLDWNTIEISGQISSGPAKKADLKNDYKLILELVIACLECGSGGHADDITQERAFIINALITKTKVNWAKHFFNSVSKHLGKPKQKYLCQGLYLGHILESMGIASEGKKYDARYWLYYLSTKCENIASSTAEDEGSSDNVLIKTNEDLLLEHLTTSPPSEFEVDDDYTAVYTPMFFNSAGNQIENQAENITAEAQANLEAEAEDFQVFPESSLTIETVLDETILEGDEEVCVKANLVPFWSPQQIITDNGTQFEAKGFNEFLQSWGIKHNYAAVRTTPRKATGETLFALTYGFEARALAETSLLSYRVETFDAQENEENLMAKLHLIDERRERAYIQAKSYHRQVKSYHDKKVRPRVFRMGDWVLRKREVSRPTDGGKFAKNFEGPYIIKEVLADGTYKLRTPAGGDVPRKKGRGHSLCEPQSASPLDEDADLGAAGATGAARATPGRLEALRGDEGPAEGYWEEPNSAPVTEA